MNNETLKCIHKEKKEKKENSCDGSNSRTSCNAYHYKKTIYGKKNTTTEIEDIKKSRIKILKNIMINGKLIKRFESENISLISVDMKKQLCPDTDTFDYNKYDLKDVFIITKSLMSRIPDGTR